MKAKQIPGIPLHKKGGFHDTESTKQYNEQEIDAKFEILKQRLFSINRWKEYGGDASADFRHFDSSGQPAQRDPIKGDFIRISIPGPGNVEADGFDWVEIVSLSRSHSNAYESVLMICSPSKDPNQPEGRIAHFYSKTATSNFLISKEGKILRMGVYGRNEKPNFDCGFIDKVRNFFIGIGGMLGVSKIQWKILAEGLLNFE